MTDTQQNYGVTDIVKKLRIFIFFSSGALKKKKSELFKQIT